MTTKVISIDAVKTARAAERAKAVKTEMEKTLERTVEAFVDAASKIGSAEYRLAMTDPEAYKLYRQKQREEADEEERAERRESARRRRAAAKQNKLQGKEPS